ncbi:MAG: CoA-binding protein [Dehalococcoidales bacterium]|nr:MAG: CoA-binding protein [Dehalococcoidales bacterium]
MAEHSLEEVLHPRSIAVVGASDEGRGSQFFGALVEFGFKGILYPVNPKYSEVMKIKAYPTVKDIPDPVDFVISAAPAPQVPQIMRDCAQKGVKGIHLFTARFSETGREDAIELEKEILRIAKEGGVRIIGPNCLGVYYPKMGMAFQPQFPKESGSIALASQSGQASGEIINKTTQRGAYFNKAVSYGNAIDFNECDFLEHFGDDPEIKIVMMYIEGLKNGSRFFSILREVTKTKPVVIIKGGRGQAGTRATASHTASLAGATEVWNTMISQSGAVSVSSIDELVDVAISFHYLPPITGRRAGVAAGAGGATVLAADQCEEAGLDVAPLPQEIREELRSQGVQIWDWISNPADFSINMGDENFGPAELLKMMAMHPDFDLIIASINIPGWGGPPGSRGRRGGGGPPMRGMPPWAMLSLTPEGIVKQYSQINDYKPVLGLISDRSPSPDVDDREQEDERWKTVCEVTAELVKQGIPFYPTVSRAASAANKVIDYYQRRER